MNNNPRIQTFEASFERLLLLIQDLQAAVARLQQPSASSSGGQQGGGGAGVYIMAGAIINPLGTPPNYLTNQTVDWVIGGSAIVASTTATVYNMMGFATVSGKMMVLGLNPDGSFTVITQSC